MKTGLRFVDSFIRGRGEVIERVKKGERLGRFIAGAAVMYVAFQERLRRTAGSADFCKAARIGRACVVEPGGS